MRYVAWVTTGYEDWLIEQINTERFQEKLKGLYADIWCPKVLTSFTNKGVTVLKKTPMFPGYVLVETEESKVAEVHRILKGIGLASSSGLSSVACYGILRDEKSSSSTFIPIKPEEEELIQRLTERSEDRTMGASLGVIKDGKLIIVDGPLKGMEQYVEHIDKRRKKVVLKMKLFGEERIIRGVLEIVGE